MARILENKLSDEETASFVTRIEAINEQILSEKGQFMRRCAALSEDKKTILDEAKEKGIAKAVVKAVVKVRDLERKVEAAYESLEDDDAAKYDDIRKALGDYADTPLGAAATKPQDPTTAAIVEAVKKDEKVTSFDAYTPRSPKGKAKH